MTILPRKAVQDLQPYPAPEEGRYSRVRLDFNENTQGFCDAYPGGMPAEMVSAYPEYKEFIDKLAEFHAVEPDSLLLTNGSDEGLLLVSLTFIEPSSADVAVLSRPCFVVMPHSLKIAGAVIREVPALDNLEFDVDAIDEALSPGAKMAMFATPENPTGVVLQEEIILRWCSKYPDTVFVIDEAYGEYCGRSVLSHVKHNPNLIVLKTFSKAWGMAGLRLGMIFAQPQLIDYINRVKFPFSVNTAALWTASRLLDRHAEVAAATKAAMTRKVVLEEALERRGYHLVKGESNSFLLGLGMNAPLFTNFARSRDVLVRNRSESVFPGQSRSKTWGYVRVSVGSDDENNKFLDTLSQFEMNFGVLLDLDGTLVDTTESFDQTVCELVHRHSQTPLTSDELCALRAEGGYNDDWVAARELIRRRGKEVPLAVIAREAVERYLELAPVTEKLMCAEEVLVDLGARYPLFIVTGRTRPEYDPVWSDKLKPYFRHVYCLDDVAGKLPKPAPDYLAHVVDEHVLHSGVYVGNSVDDMQAARAAGMYAIGVATTQPADVLIAAGAHYVLPGIASLKEVFML